MEKNNNINLENLLPSALLEEEDNCEECENNENFFGDYSPKQKKNEQNSPEKVINLIYYIKTNNF